LVVLALTVAGDRVTTAFVSAILMTSTTRCSEAVIVDDHLRGRQFRYHRSR